jgi:transposase
MGKKRNSYDKEFKQMAVNLCLSGKTTGEVADDLGLRSELVRRWKREHEKYGNNSFAGNGNVVMTDQEKEIAQLKKELRDLQIERDILKKAVSIFSRSDSKNTSL